VTIRDRDSTQQMRVPIADVGQVCRDLIGGRAAFSDLCREGGKYLKFKRPE
jgi:hypothetical protein